MHPGHHGRMRTTEVQLHHRQAGILDGAANINPALHRLATGTANQVRALVSRVFAQLDQMRQPFPKAGAGITRTAVEHEVLVDLAFDQLVLLVQDGVLRVLRQTRHVLDVGQGLDDHARGTSIDALLDHLRTVGGLERGDDDRVLELDAAEFQG